MQFEVKLPMSYWVIIDFWLLVVGCSCDWNCGCDCIVVIALLYKPSQSVGRVLQHHWICRGSRNFGINAGPTLGSPIILIWDCYRLRPPSFWHDLLLTQSFQIDFAEKSHQDHHFLYIAMELVVGTKTGEILCVMCRTYPYHDRNRKTLHTKHGFPLEIVSFLHSKHLFSRAFWYLFQGRYMKLNSVRRNLLGGLNWMEGITRIACAGV